MAPDPRLPRSQHRRIPTVTTKELQNVEKKGGQSPITVIPQLHDPWFLICTWAQGSSFLPYLPYWVFTRENGCERFENPIMHYELLLSLPRFFQHLILPAIQ